MKRFFIFILMVNCGMSIAQDTTVYSLEQCINLAIKNNIDVTKSELQVQRTKASLWQSRTYNLPYVSGYASQGMNQGKSINPYTNTFINQKINTGQYGLNAGMTLWNGFSNLNLMRQNYFNNKASEYDLIQERLDISIAVTLAYLQVLSNEEILKQAGLQVATSRAQVERLELLKKNDAISPDNYHNTRGQLSSDKLRYINAKAALGSAKIDLARLMNIDLPASVKFTPVDVNVPQQVDIAAPSEIFTQASSFMGSVKAAGYRNKSTKRYMSAAMGMFLPTLSLNGSLGTNYSDAALSQVITGVSDVSTDNYVIVNNSQTPVYSPQYSFSSNRIKFNDQFKNNLNSYVGLNLQVPIFNTLRNRTRFKQAKIDHEQAEAQEKTISNGLKFAIEQNHINMTSAFEKYQILTEQVSDFSESFKVASSKFEKGAITSVDYMIAKNNNDHAALDLIAAKYDYVLKSKILDYYKNKPVK